MSGKRVADFVNFARRWARRLANPGFSMPTLRPTEAGSRADEKNIAAPPRQDRTRERPLATTHARMQNSKPKGGWGKEPELRGVAAIIRSSRRSVLLISWWGKPPVRSHRSPESGSLLFVGGVFAQRAPLNQDAKPPQRPYGRRRNSPRRYPPLVEGKRRRGAMPLLGRLSKDTAQRWMHASRAPPERDQRRHLS